MNIRIPKEVERVLNLLQKSGFEAYIVGGCVRDSIMGISPSDWDITTSASPEDISSCFSGCKTIETGIKHGTIAVIINKMQIEITTYRIDGEYSDNRRPDNVLFTDNIELDLKRRDFTINALAYNKNGIIDLFAGAGDIHNKIIRCVGDPDERFSEDGLRILRALRFASVLNFEIEKHTAHSVHKNKNLLINISMERINAEFNKLIMGSNFQTIIMENRDVIEVFIPELGNIDNGELTYRLRAMKNLNSLDLRLTALLYKIEAPDSILIRLKYDNSTIKSVKLLTSNIDKTIDPNAVSVKKSLHKINYVNLKNLIKIKKELFENEHDKIERIEEIMNEIISTNQCYNLETLAISGQDLLDAGIPKGKNIGKVLNIVLNEVIEGQLENRKDSLHKFIYVNQEHFLNN